MHYSHKRSNSISIVGEIFYLFMTWLIFILAAVGVGIVICNFLLVFSLRKRLEKLEKEVFQLLKGLDDKNYTLWKSRLKAEEKLKKLNRR